MKIKTKVITMNNTYVSLPVEISEEKLKALKEFFKNKRENMTYLEIEIKDGYLFFPNKILQESIIKLEII